MGGKRTDITGVRFGRLVVVSTQGSVNGRSMWLCKCDCGNEKAVRRDFLKSGATQSCGCIREETMSDNHKKLTKHGFYQTPTYATWESMKQRCSNPKTPGYMLYGGRGITFCERWNEFENFLADMGERPEGKTLDRINADGDYCPSNCRWATTEEQANNKRNTKKITWNGQELTIRQMSKISGVAYATIWARIINGKPPIV